MPARAPAPRLGRTARASPSEPAVPAVPVTARAQVIAHESGASLDVSMDLAKLGEKVRHLKASGLEEGVSTRLLVYAGQLIGRGVAPRRACEVSVSKSLTDDLESQRAIDELASSIFGT